VKNVTSDDIHETSYNKCEISFLYMLMHTNKGETMINNLACVY